MIRSICFLAMLFFASVLSAEELIVSADQVPEGSSVVVMFKAPSEFRDDLPYTISPVPPAALRLLDEDGNRVLIILNAAKPGYTIKVDARRVRPDAADIAYLTPEIANDKDKLEEWLARNSKDTIVQGEKFIKVGDGVEPGPKPDPDPQPEPEPDPTPAPIPVDGFRVLIVYESADMTKYPIEQQLIMGGSDVREFLSKNCKQTDGHPGWRIWDQHIDASGDLPLWQAAMKRERKSLPWVIISNGKTGYEGPLPAGPTAFLELAKKYLPK